MRANDRASEVDQLPALVGQRDRFGLPIEEDDSQLRLDLLDLAAQRRLGNAELGRRAPEVTVLVDRENILELGDRRHGRPGRLPGNRPSNLARARRRWRACPMGSRALPWG